MTRCIVKHYTTRPYSVLVDRSTGCSSGGTALPKDREMSAFRSLRVHKLDIMRDQLTASRM